jgi:four helix bundle protein
MSDNSERKNDLRARTKWYARIIIRLYVALQKLKREELRVIGRQFLRSGTSVAANYREASRARSDAEFISKIEICAQEADETLLWMELLDEECGIKNENLDFLLKESDELIAIFTTMSKNTKKRAK